MDSDLALIVAGLSLCALLLLGIFLLQTRFRAEMEQAAIRLGFSFEAAPRDGPASVEKFLGFNPFRPDLLKEWRMSGLMTGVVDGVPTVVFWLASKLAPIGRPQGVLNAVFAFEGNPLPLFTLHRKGMLDTILFLGDSRPRGSRTIEFSENPEFSKAYAVYGEDEQAIRGLFQPSVLRAFAARPAGFRRGSSFVRVATLYKNLLVVYMPAMPGGPSKVTLEFLQDASNILAIFKRALLAEPLAS